MTSAQKRAPRIQGPRVSITATPELDHVLGRIAAGTGTGKATFVREWLLDALPQLEQLATAIELAKSGNVDAFAIMAQVVRDASSEADQLSLDIKRDRRRAMRKRPK